MTVTELTTELQAYPSDANVALYIYPHVLVKADETDYDTREKMVVIS